MKEKKKKKDEPVVNQVFQGTYCRENNTFLSKLFFSYITPLLQSAFT